MSLNVRVSKLMAGRRAGWVAWLGALAVSVSLQAADAAGGAEKERQLIAQIKADVPPQDKALAFKQLAIYGGKDAVPALAEFLGQPELSSWARIALEAIPDPSALEALRTAVGKVQGRLLIGVINSIGVRRDPQAVAVLVPKLTDADADVASAAATALGRIGGDAVAKALTPSLADAPAGVRSAVALGCIYCAEGFQARGEKAAAVALFDRVRAAAVPKQRVLEATRGAILARGAEGLPLLLETLAAPDRGAFEIGLRTARELPGRPVTEGLAAAVAKAAPERQGRVLLAIADRPDDAALPAVRTAVASGPKSLRLAAIGALEHIGDVSCVAPLLDAAADADAEVARAARSTLVKLTANGVDAELTARFASASGAKRQVLIDLAGQRGIAALLPAILQSANDADPAVRRAAVGAIASLGKPANVADLAKLLEKSKAGTERDDIERALLSLSSRSGAAAAADLVPLARNADAGIRALALGALASAGGPEALAAVKAALEDKDEAVQDEAVRTLATWPNNWPDDEAVAAPLLALAKSGRKPLHQILGFRGYLEYVKGDKKIKDDDKLARIEEILPLMKLTDEKRAAVAVVGTIPSARAIQMLTGFAGDAEVAEEACAALVPLAAKGVPGLSKDQRRQTLQTVLEKSKVDATRNKADEALKKLGA